MTRKKKPIKSIKESGKTIIPLHKALLWIFLSVAAISGSSYAAFLYYRYHREMQRQDPSYNILAIIQSSNEPLQLSTDCLAEMLQLSSDKPTNIFCFNEKEAAEKLKQSAVIKDVNIQKIEPSVVLVDYSLRKAVAILADYTNTAVDAEGILFPIQPYLALKNIPLIYLGKLDGDYEENCDHDTGLIWGRKLAGRRAELALELVETLSTTHILPYVRISCVDVSKAYASSCGERQIVISFDELIGVNSSTGNKLAVQKRILRLGSDNYKRQLANYLVLQKQMRKFACENSKEKRVGVMAPQATIIDLRLSNLAFIVEDS